MTAAAAAGDGAAGADWEAEWQPVIDAVGRDFEEGQTTWGADPVEPVALE